MFSYLFFRIDWRQSIRVLSLFLLSFSLLAEDLELPTAGKTIIARGNVTATSEGVVRPLKRRSPIYQIDKIQTGANSRAQLRMVDGGMIALKENSELEIADYKYDANANEGTAVMKLISGGIRTVTGKLKRENGHYKLDTPVGSIGIRGTHYEVELVAGELFVAVWDGQIDVTVTVNSAPSTPVIIGDNAQFRYMKVNEKGNVETFTEIPETFKDGYSSTTEDESAASESGDSASASTTNNNTESPQVTNEAVTPTGNTNTENTVNNQTLANETAEPDVLPNLPVEVEVEVNEELFNDLAGADDDFLADRTGIADFSTLVSHGITSSAGEVNNVEMMLEVNFDRRTIDNGVLSFTDPNGEWFATFNGVINDNALEMGINFASHGDNKAQGDINGGFINSGDTILGDVALSEIDNPDNNAGGTFTLGEKN